MSPSASLALSTDGTISTPGQYLDVADTVLVCLGIVVIVLAIARFVLQEDRRRTRFLPPTRSRLTFESVLLPMFAWVMIGALGSYAVDKFVARAHQGVAMIYVGNGAHLLGGLACLFVANVGFRGGWRRFVLGRRRPGIDVRNGVLAVLVAFPICWGILVATGWIIQQVAPGYPIFEHDVVETLRAGDVPIWTLWIGTTLIAPFAEEVFFRGICQTFLMQVFRSRWPAILLIALVFGAVHAGGERPQLHVVPALTAFGLILGILYARTRSLAGPIVVHALFNAKTLLWETLRAAT